jgi:hypothetical protein
MNHPHMAFAVASIVLSVIALVSMPRENVVAQASIRKATTHKTPSTSWKPRGHGLVTAMDLFSILDGRGV